MTAGHEVVPGAFGGAFGQHGRFHLNKAGCIKVLPNALIEMVSFDKKILHGLASKVQVSILKPQIFRDGFGNQGAPGHHCLFRNGKWQRSGLAEDCQIHSNNFYGSGFNGWIFRTPGTFGHSTGHADAKFVSQKRRLTTNLPGGIIRTEYHLNNAASIPQMNKQDISMVSQCIYPAEQLDVTPDMGQIKPATVRPSAVIHNAFFLSLSL
jgi:hypothetical protein